MAAANKLFQYSILPALMDGVAERGLPLSRLLAHGDFGLGTFRHIAGEMIVHQGRVWQMKYDGTVSSIDTSDMTNIAPFAMVTNFQPTLRERIPHSAASSSIGTKYDIAMWLRNRIPSSRNLVLAVRLRGTFKSLTIRMMPSQQYPGQPLSELSQYQVVQTLTGVRGTLIGFCAPSFMQSLSVPGLHLHFLSEDATRGGHILGVTIGPVNEAQASKSEDVIEIDAALMSQLDIELPTDDPDYSAAPLHPNLAAMERVEG